MLLEQDRTKLDGIVQKMIQNGESDKTIQRVVDDFKRKYDSQEIAKMPNAPKEKLSFIERAVQPAIQSQRETVGAFQRGEQGIVSSLFQTGGNIIKSAFAPFGQAIKEVTPEPIKEAAAAPFKPLAKGIDIVSDKAAESETLQRFAMSDAGKELERNLEAALEYLAIAPVGKVSKPVTGTIQKVSREAAEATQRQVAKETDQLVGKIIQGKTDDISKARRAIGGIDTTNIKTYGDLYDTLNTKVSVVSNRVDELLGSNQQKYSFDDIARKTDVNGITVSQNYVDDALNQLEELYSKINDPVNAQKVVQLRNKAQSEGLTIKEINDIARLHGNEFSQKAFSKVTGEPLTSVNAQAFENVRSGIKETARELFDDPAFKALDSEISDIIRTRDLTQRLAEKVNQLAQRVNQRGIGEKAGRLVFQALNTITGGGLAGFVQSFVPRGQGLKILNALDLERGLSRNLKRLDSLLDDAISDKTFIKRLQDYVDDISKQNLQKGGAENPLYRRNLKSLISRKEAELKVLQQERVTLGKKGTTQKENLLKKEIADLKKQL